MRANAPIRPRPDLSLVELVEMIEVKGSAQEERAHIIAQLLSDVRECAKMSKITVWGRKNYTLGYDHMYYFPLSNIPSEFWEHDSIYLTYFLRGGVNALGETTRSPYSNLNGYSDIRFNRQQIVRAIARGQIRRDEMRQRR